MSGPFSVRRLVPACLVLALATACSPGPGSDPPAPEGIDVTLRSPDGESLELSSLRGKVVLVDVWATWCGPCLRALPGLSRLSESRPDDLVVIGLSADQDVRALRGFLKRNPLPYFVAHGDPRSLSLFRAEALPTIYVLDRQGRIVDRVVGALPESILLQRASRHF